MAANPAGNSAGADARPDGRRRRALRAGRGRDDRDDPRRAGGHGDRGLRRRRARPLHERDQEGPRRRARAADQRAARGRGAAVIAIVLAFGAKDLNIANVANIAFAIAASTTMPTLLLTIYWRRFNQVGALSAMIGGLIVSVGLVLLGPDVMGKDDAIWPLAIPAIVSVPASFLFAYVGTLIGAGRVRVDRDALRRVRGARVRAGRGRSERPLHPQGSRARAGGRRVTDAARAYLELAGGGPLRAEAFLDEVGARPHGRAGAGAGRQGGARARAGAAARARARRPRARARHLVRRRCCARPPEALERLDDFRATGVADLGAAHAAPRGPRGRARAAQPAPPQRRGRRHARPTEVAVDLMLLDPDDRGRRAARRRRSSTRATPARRDLRRRHQPDAPLPRADLLPVLHRRATSATSTRSTAATAGHARRARGCEKLWIAAVETYAIGGACQLLHVMDHVIAERGARLFLPARKEGIIPGASNLRLPRFVGERLARQAILSGREFEAGTPEGDLLVRRDRGAGGDGRRDRRPGWRR